MEWRSWSAAFQKSCSEMAWAYFNVFNVIIRIIIQIYNVYIARCTVLFCLLFSYCHLKIVNV